MHAHIIKTIARHSIASVCIALVCIGVFLLCSFHDRPLKAQLFEIYEESGLLDLEAPLYLEFLQRRFNIEQLGSAKKIDQVSHWIEADKVAPLVLDILRNDAFREYIQAEGNLFLSPEQFDQWRDWRLGKAQAIYVELLSHKMVLLPDDNSIADLVTYTFVQPTTFALIIALAFLLLLGWSVEQRLGALGAIQLGILSTVFLGLLYRLFASDAAPYIYGISFFVLPWFAVIIGSSCRDLYDALAGEGFSRRALMKCIGAVLGSLLFAIHVAVNVFLLDQGSESQWLLGVGLLAMTILFALTGINMFETSGQEQDGEPDDEINKEWEYRVALAEAMDLISSLDFEAAKQQLRKMIQLYPTDPEVLKQLYLVEKLQPDGLSYWACMVDLIQLGIRNKDYALMRMLFADIQKNASSKALARERLKPEHYHKMMAVFVEHDDMEKAEQSFLFLELAGQQNIIKDACLLLKQEFRNRRNIDKEQQYQMLLERL